MINRVNLILRTKNLSPSQFADEIGAQRSSMSHILSGRNNPSLEFITKVLARFPEIQTDWLIFGKGAMYKDSNISENLKIETEVEKKPTEQDLFSQIVQTSNEISEKQNIVASSITEREKIEINKDADLPFENSIFHSPTHSEPFYATERREKTIEKFVILYNDKTFCEYYPEKK